MREIIEGGGEASICEARFVEGLSDKQVEALFHAARDADYAQLADDVRALFESLPRGKDVTDVQRREVEAQLTRLRRQFGEVTTIEFLGAPGREAAEYTHEGDHCTFEVLVKRFHLEDAALRPIAEIVHDIDLKDAKFERPEATGIDRLAAGIAMAHKDDSQRLERGAAVFDDPYESFKRKRAWPGGGQLAALAE